MGLRGRFHFDKCIKHMPHLWHRLIILSATSLFINFFHFVMVNLTILSFAIILFSALILFNVFILSTDPGNVVPYLNLVNYTHFVHLIILSNVFI